ncbi:outer membrane protein assembly factor BamB family protein [Kutzneria chonburiensis]|uniref:PQQ-binding-like beta-propeller repeat protein n=1 Tax=Kutzneria chonburiensis TaxID=1483604 RepID=A0ABV6MVW6_9PSEU|nr:PQQ-binding-like beta-propeller repeat protein [Kutzneria chonburiensis]
MRGMVHGATAGAAVAFVASWFLPWMAGAAAFPLLGHAFHMWYWFTFDGPGLGAGLEIVLLGLLGLVAIASAFLAAPRTAAVTAVLGAAVGVHLMLREHPGLESGPGPLVTAVALAVVAVAQALRGEVGRWSAIATAVVTALLAVATGFGASAYAAARDVDATTSSETGAVTVEAQDGALSGVTARDSATRAERWHYRARGWTFPSVKLSGDGSTVFVVALRVTEREAVAFDARSGKLRWQRALSEGSWPGPPEGPAYEFFPAGPGLVLEAGTDHVRYFDADGRESTIRLDGGCGFSAAGGVRTQYIVEQCQGRLQLFAAGQDGRHLWTTPAFEAPTGGIPVVEDKGDTVVVSTGGGTDTFDAATGKPRR